MVYFSITRYIHKLGKGPVFSYWGKWSIAKWRKGETKTTYECQVRKKIHKYLFKIIRQFLKGSDSNFEVYFLKCCYKWNNYLALNTIYSTWLALENYNNKMINDIRHDFQRQFLSWLSPLDRLNISSILLKIRITTFKWLCYILYLLFSNLKRLLHKFKCICVKRCNITSVADCSLVR